MSLALAAQWCEFQTFPHFLPPPPHPPSFCSSIQTLLLPGLSSVGLGAGPPENFSQLLTGSRVFPQNPSGIKPYLILLHARGKQAVGTLYSEPKVQTR